MKDRSFTTTIEVDKSPQEVFHRLTDVSRWWGGKDLEVNIDEFTITHGDAHYSRQKLVEIVPDRKIVWLITESKMNWLKKDKSEWTDTRLIFEITPKDGKTELRFTHEGLVPKLECYARCSQEGWNLIIKDYLFNFITQGKPHFV